MQEGVAARDRASEQAWLMEEKRAHFAVAMMNANGFKSMPTAENPNALATYVDVPLPFQGSRTLRSLGRLSRMRLAKVLEKPA